MEQGRSSKLDFIEPTSELDRTDSNWIVGNSEPHNLVCYPALNLRSPDATIELLLKTIRLEIPEMSRVRHITVEHL